MKKQFFGGLILICMVYAGLTACGDSENDNLTPPPGYVPEGQKTDDPGSNSDDPDPNAYITFKNSLVSNLCIAHFDANNDGKLSYAEAAAVVSLKTIFRNQLITSFDELKYFKGLKSINHQAFEGCSDLTSITIPNSVDSIGRSAFHKCYSLSSVTISVGVATIGGEAFENCTGLKSISIPNSVTSIGIGAFSNCSGLTSITIPNSVTSIGDYAFYNCSKLTSIESLIQDPTKCTLSSGAFPYASTTLYVPKGTIEKYKAAGGWKNFKNIVEK